MTEVLPFVEDTVPLPVQDSMKYNLTAPRTDSYTPKLEEDNKKQDRPEKKKETRPENEVTSLTFDQVNDNADELIELRGEGRYFGVTDPSSGTTINNLQSMGPLCANCHKRGHIRAKCKTVVCHKCGVVGDHYETQCPTTMICSKCGNKGHMAANCTNKNKKRQYCNGCDSFNHTDDTCPSIWRSYLTLPSTDNESVLPVMYCYNCGDKYHYGDECPRQRSSRIPNPTGSAFSGVNLPRHLRDLYYKRLEEGAQPSRYGRNDVFSFELSYGDGYKRNSKNKSQGNNNYNNNYNSNYSNNNNNNNNYNNNYNNNQGNNRYTNRDFSASTINPSRSGYLSAGGAKKKKSPAPTKTGFIKNGKVTKPKSTRSAYIESSKQKRKKLMNLMY